MATERRTKKKNWLQAANLNRQPVSITFTHFAQPMSSLLGASRPPPVAGLGATWHKALLNQHALRKDCTL